jgi:hypothetical protein
VTIKEKEMERARQVIADSYLGMALDMSPEEFERFKSEIGGDG